MTVVNNFSNDLFDDENFLMQVQARKKRKMYRFITRIVFFILVWATLLTYYLTPIGRVGNPVVRGNYYLTAQEVLALAELNKNNLLINVDQKQIRNKLDASPRVKNVETFWSPIKLTISLNEIIPIGKSFDDKVILSNGELLNDYVDDNPTYDLTSDGLHLAEFIDLNSPFNGKDARQIAFLENLKLIDKELFSKVDYLDITVPFKDSSDKYFGIYVKIEQKTYVRIRATVDVLGKVYMKYFLEDIIKSYLSLQFGVNSIREIIYYSATCGITQGTDKLQCKAL